MTTLDIIFTHILNMSITAGYVILAVLLIRFVLKKLPKKYSYMLWSVVAFRLAVPISFSSVFSMFSLRPFEMSQISNTESATMQYINPYEGSMSRIPEYAVNTGIAPVNEAIAGIYNDPSQQITSFLTFKNVFSYIWITVAVLIILYGAISYIILRVKMSNSVLLKDNIYQSDKISSPFILGFISPKIYIPFSLDEKAYDYVLAHEKYHIARYDYYIKAFAFILLAVHWFNPLCWLAYYLMTKDMEMSCDERVLSENTDIKKAYSTALLSCAVNGKISKITPLCFGENSVKARIKNILKFKKPKTIVSIIVFILCLLTIVGCAANPKLEKMAQVSESTLSSTESSVDDYITDAIISCESEAYYNGDNYDNYSRIFGESHHIFCTQNGDLDGKNPDKYITVYLYAVIKNVSFIDGEAVNNPVGIHPCAIVFEKSDNGYNLAKYWKPTDDIKYFREDVEKVFCEEALQLYDEFLSDFKTYNDKLTAMKEEAYNQIVSNHPIEIADMTGDYSYVHKLLEQTTSNTQRIKIISDIIRTVRYELFSSENAVPEAIAELTGAEYIGDIGSGIYVYEFKYGDITFDISTIDNSALNVTYYINGSEYAYQSSSTYGKLEITTQDNDNTHKSSIKAISQQEAVAAARKELEKKTYSECVQTINDFRTQPTLMYRPFVNNFTYEDGVTKKFVYDITAEYAYVIAFDINKDDSRYNSCEVWINAENGNIMMLEFLNIYDMV